ncbi:50S ribosomal protein L10 [Candidatus Saganbacteria bacterium]|nr:50S ribosomal protein L10 [Candidatus Saganbacteria bacterium]
MREVKVRPEKVEKIKDINDKLGRSNLVILTDYQGMTVKQITELRRKLDAHQAEYRVLKNTLTIRALPEDKAPLKEHLTGTTAVLFGFGDVVMPAKALVNFIAEAEKPKIIGGMMDGQFLPEAQIKSLAKLPSREELLAKVVGGMQAPIRGLVNVMQGNLRKLVYALNAVKDKKSQGGE